MSLVLSLSPRRSALLLGFIALCLSLISVFGEYITSVSLPENTDTFIVLLFDLWSVNAEQTIPTWYSVILLFLAGALLLIIALDKLRTQAKFRWYWLGLALIFFYLSMDEGAVIHEMLSDPLQALFGTSGFFNFGWLVAAIPLVIIIGLLYLRFLFSLPNTTRWLFILSGGLFISGAVVIEGISAYVYELNGNEISFVYLAIATMEETAEMLGVVLFIYALLQYCQLQSGQIVVNMHADGGQDRSRPYSYVGRILGVFFLLVILGLSGLWWVTPQITTPETELASTTTRFTGNSPYHPVVVRDEIPTALNLVIDGEVYVSLPEPTFQQRLFDVLVQQLPAQNAQRILILSAGSQQIAKDASQISNDVTVVSIDPTVLGASQLYFDTLARGHLPGLYATVVENPRDFLDGVDTQFSLMMTHFPLTVGGVYQQFYTQAFYAQIQQALTPDGMFLSMVNDSPLDEGTTAQLALSAIAEPFSDHYAVYFIAEDKTLLVAGNQLPVSADQLSQLLRDAELSGFLIIND